MEAVGELLGIRDGDIQSQLSHYIPEDSPFAYQYAIHLREHILNHGHKLLAAYEDLMSEVIAPMFLKDHGLDQGEVLYQFPPTLRIFPSVDPPRALGRFHTDHEYGHQVCEINYWLPITNAGGDHASLWCEQSAGLGNFAPFDLKYGEIRRFHAVSLAHGTYPNDTGRTRISLDFRLALEEEFDRRYTHPGPKVRFKHLMRRWSAASSS